MSTAAWARSKRRAALEPSENRKGRPDSGRPFLDFLEFPLEVQADANLDLPLTGQRVARLRGNSKMRVEHEIRARDGVHLRVGRSEVDVVEYVEGVARESQFPSIPEGERLFQAQVHGCCSR